MALRRGEFDSLFVGPVRLTQRGELFTVLFKGHLPIERRLLHLAV